MWNLKRSDTDFNSVIPVGSRSPNGSVLHVVMHTDMECVCRLGEKEIAAKTESGELVVLTPPFWRGIQRLSNPRCLSQYCLVKIINGLVGIVNSVGAPNAKISTSSKSIILMFSANIRAASETYPACYSVGTGGSFIVVSGPVRGKLQADLVPHMQFRGKELVEPSLYFTLCLRSMHRNNLMLKLQGNEDTRKTCSYLRGS